MLGASAELGAADRAIASAHAELGAALQIDEVIRLTDDPLEFKPNVFSREEAEVAALEAEPEFAAAGADAHATEDDLRASKGGYWPQLSLVGEAFGGVGSLPPGATNTSPFWGAAFAGVQLSWPIFDALETWRQVKEAELTQRRSNAELGRLRHRLLARVRARHAELTMLLGEIDPLRQAVAAARTTLDVVRRRYESGAARLFEVIDVERELFRVEHALIGRAVSIAEADVRLRAVMGRL
jgi:outer membrane protein